MLPYLTVIFDLDGTITDSAPGILNSIRYALDKLGLPDPGTDALRSFIGPPLHHSFSSRFKLNETDTERMVACYREYFIDKGLFENSVYAGIPELLSSLADTGAIIGMATVKPLVLTRRILDHFDLANYFTAVCGSNLGGPLSSKKDLIADALTQLSVTDKTRTVMVGDRGEDIRGARANGLTVIAAGYGYGTAKEIQDAGPDMIAGSVTELAWKIQNVIAKNC